MMTIKRFIIFKYGQMDVQEDEKDKKKKKVKLEYHPMQTFLDDKDVYVWIFDPTPLWKKLVGLGMGTFCNQF